MGHIKTLLLKIIVNALPVFLILYLAGEQGWVTALFLTFLLIGIAYVIGDLFILPQVGNVTATIADVLLAVGLLWSSKLVGLTVSNRALIYTALAVALAEGLFYHPYLKRLVSIDSMGPKFGDRG